MMRIGIAFNRPQSIFGKFVVWRTGEPYSHAVVVVYDHVYSAELLDIRIRPFNPEIYDEIYWFDITYTQFREITNWLDSRVGKNYDYLALLGFLLGWDKLNHTKFHYCFEFCRTALSEIFLLPERKDLITGNELLQDVRTLHEAVHK